MKRLMIAAALLMGTAAVAQTADPAMQEMPATPDQTTPPMDDMAPPTDPAATPTDPMTTPPQPADPMAMPAPAAGDVTMGTPVNNPPPPPPAEYPPCSATVTDQCIQRGG